MITGSSLAALTDVASAATPPRAPASPTIVIKDDSGFHWFDAGIGGAAVLAVLPHGLRVDQPSPGGPG